MDIFNLLISIVVVSGIFFVMKFFQTEDFLKLSPELKKEIQRGAWRNRDHLSKRPLPLTRPFFGLNALILSRIGRKKVADKLSLAEIEILPEDFLGIKELLIILAVGGVFFFRGYDPMALGIALLLGFSGPDIVLSKKIIQRKKAVVAGLPDAIDLLNLCVGSGLDFMLGMNWVVERSKPGPLMKEFSLVNHNIKMGKGRQDALRDMAKRLNVSEINSFVNALVHADRMGTPISEVLSMLSDEARRQRFQRGRRLAMAAPIKMLFPLILFILPVVVIIVGGPVILQFLQGGMLPGL